MIFEACPVAASDRQYEPQEKRNTNEVAVRAGGSCEITAGTLIDANIQGEGRASIVAEVRP
jgi:hypothetical protein